MGRCHRRERSQRGYAMVALLVALSVMAVLLGAVLPVYSTMARRERETELVFRGEQYARAIRLYQQQFGNALPADVDVLLGMRFLRREYLDPITGEEFQYLGPNDPELAEALNSEPAGGRDDDDEDEPESDFQRYVRETQDSLRQLTQQTGGAAGGIVAVTSTSTAESLRVYNGRDHYNEWVFIAVQQSQQAGQGAEGGDAGARGRGGAGIELQPGGRGPRGGIGGRGGRGGRGDAAPRGGGRGGRGGFGGGGGGRGGRGF